MKNYGKLWIIMQIMKINYKKWWNTMKNYRIYDQIGILTIDFHNFS